MNDCKRVIQEEINHKKSIIYHSPLAKKTQRTMASPEASGPVRKFSEEEIWLENLRRLVLPKGGLMT